jgi:anaerobic selenocysteine-containing dehydrogenase
MLGLAHTLIATERADLEFLARYCTGYEACARTCSAKPTASSRTPRGQRESATLNFGNGRFVP